MLTWKSILIIGAALLLMLIVIFIKTNNLDAPKEKIMPVETEKTLLNKKNLTELKNNIKSTVLESIDEEIQKEVQKEVEQSININGVSK